MAIKLWYAALGIVGAGVAVATGACAWSTTHKKTPPGDDSGTPATEASASDASTASDSSAEPDVTSTTEAATSCTVALDTGSSDCDTCAATMCCTPLMACDMADDAGTDDAGRSACEQLLGCINDVNSSGDAGGGGDADIGATSCEVSPYTASEDTNANAVFTCLRTSCATQCPGL
jgi:hypothetical protein